MKALNNGERWITSGNRVSKFTLKETECPCGCGSNDMHQGLIDILQMIRDMLGVPVKINCGVRCKEHNASVNGAKNSYHMQGMAADISVKNPEGSGDIKSEDLFDAIKYLGIPCIIKYPGHYFVHVDIRSTNELIRLVKNKNGVYIPIV